MSMTSTVYHADDYDEPQRCVYCGEELEEGQCIWLDDSTDEIYCEDCFYDQFFTCDECGEYCSVDDANRAFNRYGDEVYVCDDCLNNFYKQCESCDDYYFHSNLTDLVDEDGDVCGHVCSNCIDDHFYVCSDCNCAIGDDAKIYISQRNGTLSVGSK